MPEPPTPAATSSATRRRSPTRSCACARCTASHASSSKWAWAACRKATSWPRSSVWAPRSPQQSTRNSAMPEPAPLGVVIINGSPSLQSKTMGLTNLALAALERIVPVEVRRVDVYRLGNGFTSAGDREHVTPQVDDALRAAEQADLLIAATPVFRGSYTGLFKHFFDLIEQYALANKPVLLLATGGSEHHALVLDHALRPLFAFFQALTLPVAVFASSSDFDGTTVLNPRVYSRIQTALEDVEDLLRHRRSRCVVTRCTMPALRLLTRAAGPHKLRNHLDTD